LFEFKEKPRFVLFLVIKIFLKKANTFFRHQFLSVDLDETKIGAVFSGKAKLELTVCLILKEVFR
jgi:hypothetical protein